MCIFQSEQNIKLRNVLVSLEKTNGHQIRHISNNWILCGARCWDGSFRNTRQTGQNRQILLSWRLLCYRYGMICQCYRSSLIRQLHHFKTSIVCCCSWWTFLTQFKCREGSWLHHWNVWTVDEKVVLSLIQYYWIFRTRLRVHLKKWTLNCCIYWTTCVILIKFAG